MATDDGDVLSFGPAEPSGSRSWLRSRPLALALVALSLLAGYLLGSRADSEAGAAPPGSGPETLVAGAVHESFPIDGRLAFGVQVHNGGDVALDVTVRGLGGVRLVQPDGPLRIPAHGSRTAQVLAPESCLPGSEGSLTTLTVDAGGPAEQPRQLVVPVLDSGDLASYLTALCAGASDETEASLHGVWVLDEAFAQWSRAEGVLLVWFRPDGTFRADDAGDLFGDTVAATGDYRVRGGRLSMVFDEGFVCAPGDRVEWVVHRRGPTQVALRYASGACPQEPGGVWVLQRVLAEVPAGVDW